MSDDLRITVSYLRKRSLSLVISRKKPVSSLIEMVSDRLECPQQSILLYKGTGKLEGQRLLSEYKATSFELHLVLHDGKEVDSYVGKYNITIRLIDGKICILEVDESLNVLDLKILLFSRKGLPPERQRLLLREEELLDSTALIQLNIDTELICRPVLRLSQIGRDGGAQQDCPTSLPRPGAYLVALFPWSGDMQDSLVQGLQLVRGRPLACISLACRDWLHCVDGIGRDGLVPINYVGILEIFNQELYDELKATSSSDIVIPAISMKFLKGSLVTTSIRPTGGPSWVSSWTTAFGTLRKSFRSKKTKTVSTPNAPSSSLELLSERTNVHLASLFETEDNTVPHAPPLPPFPRANQNRPVVRQHELERSTFVLEMRSMPLESAEDTPTVLALVKCISPPPERISSVSVAFRLSTDDQNEITEISPTEYLGAERHTELNLRDNCKAGFQAGIAVEAIKIGGSYEREKEIEKIATRVTQMTIKGTKIGNSEARWVLAEDPSVAGQDGLPTETKLYIKTRLKPRKIRCDYEVVVSTPNGSKVHRFPDEIVDLLSG